ncbi:MAG: MBL fold metallo-hydrolase [bacterium]|nr:MBL fold metallo-hydrolase [bacterium]
MSDAAPDEQPPPRPPRQEREPAQAEVTEIAPGLLRSQLPVNLPGIGHVNCYLLEDERGVAVVDPGLPSPASFAALEQRLGAAGYSIENVHTAVITHSHFDHFGGAERLRALAGAEILTHESFRPIWESTEVAEPPELPTAEEEDGDAQRPPWLLLRRNPWGTEREPLPEKEWRTWQAIAEDDPRWFATPRPTRTVVDAQVIRLARREWLCLHTPGHTEDHLCLFDPEEGILLSGDHVLPTITPHISGLSPFPDPLNRFFESLRRMGTIDGVRVVLPAHGHPFEDLDGRAKAIRRHHEHRLNVIRDAAGELGTGTVPQYMGRLFAERSWGNMAESETFAHLEHLRVLGDLTATQRDGQTVFSVA